MPAIACRCAGPRTGPTGSRYRGDLAQPSGAESARAGPPRDRCRSPVGHPVAQPGPLPLGVPAGRDDGRRRWPVRASARRQDAPSAERRRARGRPAAARSRPEARNAGGLVEAAMLDHSVEIVAHIFVCSSTDISGTRLDTQRIVAGRIGAALRRAPFGEAAAGGGQRRPRRAGPASDCAVDPRQRLRDRRAARSASSASRRPARSAASDTARTSAGIAGTSARPAVSAAR